ncbi:GyrI-like domain-containing protein [Methylocapsa aurea]|uniref:GyrI-like domain-containing protein n=1 Tax=Methylocapsa aurea TaxID=663610 RepID=UPI0005604089|nr:GyrI-like domain-containing protein [Methylocapsa aurea]
MRTGDIKRLANAALAIGAVMFIASSLPAQSQARQAMIVAAAESAPVVPDAAAPSDPSASPSASPAAPTEAEQPKAAPGIPTDATTVTLEVPARPVAFLSGDSDWENGFKSITGAIAKVDAAVKTAGLTPAGRPFAVFLSTDDANFHFEAMVPLSEKPEGKTELTDGVKLGSSPSGKAIKFLHRGAYEDIDSTYDLITAFLDEKGLEAKNLFIEEYLSDTKESDDASLEADIYVFLK